MLNLDREERMPSTEEKGVFWFLIFSEFLSSRFSSLRFRGIT